MRQKRVTLAAEVPARSARSVMERLSGALGSSARSAAIFAIVAGIRESQTRAEDELARADKLNIRLVGMHDAVFGEDGIDGGAAGNRAGERTDRVQRGRERQRRRRDISAIPATPTASGRSRKASDAS